MATIFVEFGYLQRDELQFPAKKLRALWFSPPKDRPDLPRIFISELKVHVIWRQDAPESWQSCWDELSAFFWDADCQQAELSSFALLQCT